MTAPGRNPGRVLFVTGTDTGVGKTLLTVLLLRHMRSRGVHALGTKPFSAGDRDDADAIVRAQDYDLQMEEVNPWFEPEPIAPGAALPQGLKGVPMGRVVRHIEGLAARCERLLVEGCGGLLVPLGRGYLVADVIASLKCQVVVVARNQLGTINHSLLTVQALQQRGLGEIRLVLMGQAQPDASAASNERVLKRFLKRTEVLSVDCLDRNQLSSNGLESNCKNLEKVLARISS